MRVGVIGGGYTGLVAALRLLQKGCEVDLFEKSPTLGGMAATFDLEPGLPLEYFYHHLFTNDTHILDLVEKLGIAERMMYLESVMGLFSRGRIYNFTTPIDLLRFRPLPLADRIRFGLGALRLRRTRDWQSLEGTTAVEAMPRFVGRAATEVIWKPLLRGKFGRHWDEVSMVWLWGKIALRGKSRKGGGAKECLIYPQGSFKIITDRLEQEIVRLGGGIHTGQEVTRVRSEAGAVRGVETSQGTHDLDCLVHTAMSKILTDVTPGLPPEYVERINRLSYVAVVCMVLELDRRFSRIYWMNNGDPSLSFGGLIEQTNFIPPENYGGRHLLYISRYLDADDPIYRFTAEQGLEFFTPHLQKVNREFSRDWVRKAHLFRYPYAQPIIRTHYSEMLPEFGTPIRGLYIANLSQIYPEDRGTNYSVRLAEQVAAQIEQDGRPR